MNWSSLFACASLVLAVVSPIITAWINSHAQKREKNDEFQLNHKIEVFENYTRDTAFVITCAYADSLHQYRQSYGKILLYTDGDLRDKIIALDELISSKAFAHSNSVNKKMLRDYNDICIDLSNYHPRLKHHR